MDAEYDTLKRRIETEVGAKLTTGDLNTLLRKYGSRGDSINYFIDFFDSFNVGGNQIDYEIFKQKLVRDINSEKKYSAEHTLSLDEFKKLSYEDVMQLIREKIIKRTGSSAADNTIRKGTI